MNQETLTSTKTEAITKIEALINQSWDIRRSVPCEALELAIEARKLSKEIESDYHIALTYRNAGTALYILSQYSEGLEQLLKAKKIFSDLNDKGGLADVIRNLGNIYHSTNQMEDAFKAYDEALKICIEINDKQGEAYNLGNIGYLHVLQSDFLKAIDFIDRTKEILLSINDRLGYSDALNNLGKAYLGTGDKDKGLHLFKRSLEEAQAVNHLRGVVNSHKSLGSYYLNINDLDKAKLHLTDSLNFAQQLGEQSVIIEIHKQLSDLYESSSDLRSALKHVKEYERLRDKQERENSQRTITSLKNQFNFDQLELEKNLLKEKNNELTDAFDIIKIKNVQLELLSLVASNTDNVILIFDEHFRLEWVNKSFSKYTGVSFSEDTLIQKPTIFEMSGNKLIEEVVKKCIDTKSSVRYDSSFVKSPSEIIWFSSTLTPIYDEENILRKLIIIDSDITEKILAQQTIDKKNKDITDSINYAQRIQNSLLPDNAIFEKLFADYFIFYKPRDIVSGDFYWISEIDDYILLAVIDCTGHGVPGAMMSMITSAFLNSVVHKKDINSPSEVLRQLYTQLNFAFTQYNSTTKTNDGMDISLLEINKITKTLRFSGVNRSIYQLREGNINEYRSLRSPSILAEHELDKLSDTTIDIKANDTFYLFTDGLTDQFGGDDNKKLGSAAFRKLLLENSDKALAKQNEAIENFYLDWKKNEQQTDDILLMGIKF